MSNQVTRLRDEISGKDLALAKDEQEHKRLDKDNEALKVFLLVMVLLVEQSVELFMFTGPLCFCRGSCS